MTKGSPKPSFVKRLEGNRGKRPIAQELTVDGNLPPPPTHFTDEQRARWEDIVRAMPNGVLKAADESTVERAAIAWAGIRDVTRMMNEEPDGGYLMRHSNGHVVVHPLVNVRHKMTRDLTQAATELGLSPLARSRIGNPENQELDPYELLMGPNGYAWSDYDDESKQ